MDAIKELTQSCLKNDVPEILIGSTVKVHVRIKEGEKERIQVFEGTVIAKNNSGISETLPFAVFPTELALSVYSLFTHPQLLRLSLYARVVYAELSFTICVTESVRLLKLRNSSNFNELMRGDRAKSPVSPCVFLIYLKE